MCVGVHVCGCEREREKLRGENHSCVLEKNIGDQN